MLTCLETIKSEQATIDREELSQKNVSIIFLKRLIVISEMFCLWLASPLTTKHFHISFLKRYSPCCCWMISSLLHAVTFSSYWRGLRWGSAPVSQRPKNKDGLVYPSDPRGQVQCFCLSHGELLTDLHLVVYKFEFWCTAGLLLNHGRERVSSVDIQSHFQVIKHWWKHSCCLLDL